MKYLIQKKSINGNPILFTIGTSAATANIPNMVYDGSELFFSLSAPSNYLSKGFIEMKIEASIQNTTSINFINGLGGFFVLLNSIDVDPELTLHNILDPPFQLKIIMLTCQQLNINHKI
jgi:hypothetical protein